jgi:hypothetical protein
MCLAPSIIAVLSIVAVLGITALGVLLILIISIHRTSRAPLSGTHDEHAGSISRRVLTGGRVTRGEAGE